MDNDQIPLADLYAVTDHMLNGSNGGSSAELERDENMETDFNQNANQSQAVFDESISQNLQNLFVIMDNLAVPEQVHQTAPMSAPSSIPMPVSAPLPMPIPVTIPVPGPEFDPGFSQPGISSEGIEWNEYQGRQKTFPFTGASGLLKALPETLTPFEAFTLFIDDDILDLLVAGTNLYAEEKIKNTAFKKHSRIQKWSPTSRHEMRKFLGLIMWMDLVQVESLSNYWSKRTIYNLSLPCGIMSRNRFELLLNNFNFSNICITDQDASVEKVTPLLNLLELKYQSVFIPGEDFVIDETLIPRQGSLTVNQTATSELHKYGVKLFKLCSAEGFTWSVKLHSGRLTDGTQKGNFYQYICQALSQKLLNQGRSMYLSNLYASYEMALTFQRHLTHVIGPIRPNEDYIPGFLLRNSLKKGEVDSREDNNGIFVLKWKDLKEVLLLSSKHTPALVNNRSDTGPIESNSFGYRSKSRPSAVLAHERKKAGTIVSDQTEAYINSIRKGIECFRKIGLQLIFSISLINAFVIYKMVTKKKINLREFRESVTHDLLELPSAPGLPSASAGDIRPAAQVSNNRHSTHHIAKRVDENNKKVRRMCVLCYAKKKQSIGRILAKKNVKKPTTFCPDCPKKPQLCFECFAEYHRPI